MKRLFPMALAALALTACRAAPEPEPPVLDVPLPVNWTAASAGGPVSGEPWWASFDEPALAAAVEEALLHNRDLAAAAERVAAAQAQARIAGADRLPAVDLSASRERRKQIFVGLPIPGSEVPSSTSTSWLANVAVSWEADLWGRFAAGEAAAEADLRASASDLEAAQHSIAAQTAKAWFAWREAWLQRELAAETVGTFERSAALVRDRYESGVVPGLDVHLAENNLASARALLEARREGLLRAERRLEVLLGRYPEAGLEAGGELPAVPPAVPAGLPGELLLRRPDLRARAERIAAGELRVHVARTALYPSLRLTATAGRTSDEVSDLLDGDFGIWSLLAGLTQNVFDGGRRRGGVELADARVRESLAAWAGAVLLALAEVEIALDSEGLLARQEGFLERASVEAAAARAQAEDRYAAGRGDLLTVLESQRRALTSESERIAARRRRLDARADLHLALGGGFAAPPIPSPEDAP